MATKISALPAAGSIASGDLIPVVSGGVTKTCTPAQILGLASIPTGTGFRHVTSNVEDATAKKVDLTAAADVTVPATANGVVTSSGTALQQPANVLAGSGFVSIGGTVPTAGSLRGTNSFELRVMNSTNASEKTLIKVAGDVISIGDAAGGIASADLYGNQSLRYIAGAIYDDAVSVNWRGSAHGTSILTATTTNVQIGVPQIGNGSAWGSLDGVGTQAMADANQTPAAAVYQCRTIKTTGALTANRNLTVPAATDAQGYSKRIRNACTGAFSIVVTTGAGTTVTIANGKTAIVTVDSGGVSRDTPDT